MPTPLVAFAVRYLEAAAGVMVTASHNPPADNGYKVYGPAGRQIVPPLDTEISEAIDRVGSLDAVPLASESSELIWRISPEVTEHYLQSVLSLVDPASPRDVRIVHTPLHGVAGDLVAQVLATAGFDDVHQVPEQVDPDPDFPTVEFPNPEEPGAMDLATAMAVEVDADLILANDPDGDRIAVGIPDGDGWRLLSGDEIGTLLAEDVLASGRLNGGRTPVVGTTVVSSSLLQAIAMHHGAGYVETLTGFKWLAKQAEEVDEDHKMVLGYEQALGVTVGDLVRDKDGISAALCVADLAARLKAAGRGIADALDDLIARHGAHVTLGRSVLLPEEGDLVQKALDGLRDDPPTDLAGDPVVQTWDHDAGMMTGADGSLEQIDLPATPLLRYVGRDGTRVMVRPSGTEPKLKFYGEAVASDDDPAAARAAAQARVEAVLDAFMARALPDQGAPEGG